jgi:hypothetical protein
MASYEARRREWIKYNRRKKARLGALKYAKSYKGKLAKRKRRLDNIEKVRAHKRKGNRI